MNYLMSFATGIFEAPMDGSGTHTIMGAERIVQISSFVATQMMKLLGLRYRELPVRATVISLCHVPYCVDIHTPVPIMTRKGNGLWSLEV